MGGMGDRRGPESQAAMSDHMGLHPSIPGCPWDGPGADPISLPQRAAPS